MGILKHALTLGVVGPDEFDTLNMQGVYKWARYIFATLFCLSMVTQQALITRKKNKLFVIKTL